MKTAQNAINLGDCKRGIKGRLRVVSMAFTPDMVFWGIFAEHFKTDSPTVVRISPRMKRCWHNLKTSAVLHLCDTHLQFDIFLSGKYQPKSQDSPFRWAALSVYQIFFEKWYKLVWVCRKVKKRYLLNEVKVGIMRMRVKDISGVPPGTAATVPGKGW